MNQLCLVVLLALYEFFKPTQKKKASPPMERGGHLTEQRSLQWSLRGLTLLWVCVCVRSPAGKHPPSRSDLQKPWSGGLKTLTIQWSLRWKKLLAGFTTVKTWIHCKHRRKTDLFLTDFSDLLLKTVLQDVSLPGGVWILLLGWPFRATVEDHLPGKWNVACLLVNPVLTL